MADALKVRVQIMNPETEEVIGEADVQTIAELVYFADKQTLQEKFDSGALKGEKGDTGAAGQRGSAWYSGTAITGTVTSGTVFSGSGITSALVNDMYLNTSTGAVYKCTKAGAANVATWAYAGSIKVATGAKGDKGDTGAQGPQGPKGEDGDSIKVGTSYASAQERKLFLKIIE